MDEPQDEPRNAENKEVREEFKLSGESLVDKVKELIREGNARRVIIKNENGRTVLEVPLAIGVVGAVIAPALAAVGAAAALLTKCTLVVIRDERNKGESEGSEPASSKE